MLKFKVDENLPAETAAELTKAGDADIRAYPPSDYAGIIVLRLARLDKHPVLSIIQRLVPLLDHEPLVGRLWIVDEASVRVHGCPTDPSWYSPHPWKTLSPANPRQGRTPQWHPPTKLWPHIRRDSLPHFDEDLDRWRIDFCNTIRPHQALGGQPPVTRFTPSPRPRPTRIPDVEYPSGSLLRKVSTVGDIRWKKFRILAGRGLVGQLVRLEERESELALFYSWKQIRALAYDQLQPDTMF